MGRDPRQLRRIGLALLAVVLTVGGPLARPVAADTVTGAQLLQRLNELRYAVGAPTISADPRVTLAAQHHADYSSLNGVGGHYETAGLAGYTGYAPRDRVAVMGWSTSFVSEVAASYSGGIYALEQLWDAPYHRLGMMHPNSVSTGWGHSDLNGRSSTVGDFVYDFAPRLVPFVRSPASGQSGIPTSWSGNESPSPLPSGVSGPVGYPIMLVYSAAQNVQMRAAEIVTPSGARLPIFYGTALWESDYQFIIPQQPLPGGTTLHVRFDITVSGQFLTNEWDFTTAGAAGTVVPPAPTFHSAFVDQSAYPTMAAGTSATVSVRFKNTGTATWQRGVTEKQANLGLNGDTTAFAALGMNDGWLSANRLATTAEASIAPGEVGTFTFQVRAPVAPGVYRLPLRPVIDGVAWMEDQGVFLVVTSDVGYHSRWTAQSPYPTLAPGQTSAPLTLTFTNTGTKPWVKGAAGQQADLGINLDDRTWSGLSVDWFTPDRPAVQAEAVVAPGETGTFTFQVKAPAAPGIYSIHLRPVIDGTVWMEDEGVFLVVTVR
ncbi:MAG: hypothetical protein NVSMB8_08550 [Candidatus Limnocylindrales bacterium]